LHDCGPRDTCRVLYLHDCGPRDTCRVLYLHDCGPRDTCRVLYLHDCGPRDTCRVLYWHDCGCCSNFILYDKTTLCVQCCENQHTVRHQLRWFESEEGTNAIRSNLSGADSRSLIRSLLARFYIKLLYSRSLIRSLLARYACMLTA
jgi:hypothetical protein